MEPETVAKGNGEPSPGSTRRYVSDCREVLKGVPTLIILVYRIFVCGARTKISVHHSIELTLTRNAERRVLDGCPQRMNRRVRVRKGGRTSTCLRTEISRGRRRRPGIEDGLTRNAVSDRAGLSQKRDLFHANIQIHIAFCQRKAIWASAEVGRANLPCRPHMNGTYRIPRHAQRRPGGLRRGPDAR